MRAADRLTFLHLAPHPDDEAIGAPATLLGLVAAGHTVINLACGLGRPEQRRRRRRELAAACATAGFELIEHKPPLRITANDDRAKAQRDLVRTVRGLVEKQKVHVIVAPSPHDRHHGHEVVGRAARDVVESVEQGSRPRLWLWGLWSELPWPTLYHGFAEAQLQRVFTVLEAHAGELERNDYRIAVHGRAAANRSLGSERIFGWGRRMRDEPYAELLMEALLGPDGEWWTGGARALDPAMPLEDPPASGRWREIPIGWWLHAASFADQTGQRHAPERS